MSRRNKLDNYTIVIIIIILAGIGILAACARILNGKLQEIESIRYDIATEYSRRDNYQELLKDYKRISNEGLLDKLDQTLPTEDNILEVIRELETIASLSQNTILMNFGETRLTSTGFELPGGSRNAVSRGGITVGEFSYIPIEVTIEGSYAGVQRFINLLQNSKFYLNINGLQINPTTGTRVNTFMEVWIFIYSAPPVE